MHNIGIIGGFAIQWSSWSGAVIIGDQRATRANGEAEFADLPEQAWEIACNCIRRESSIKKCFLHPHVESFAA